MICCCLLSFHRAPALQVLACAFTLAACVSARTVSIPASTYHINIVSEVRFIKTGANSLKERKLWQFLQAVLPSVYPGMSGHRPPPPPAAQHLGSRSSSSPLLSEKMFTARSRSGQVASRLLTSQLLLCSSGCEAEGDRLYQAAARAGRQQKSGSAPAMLPEGSASPL